MIIIVTFNKGIDHIRNISQSSDKSRQGTITIINKWQTHLRKLSLKANYRLKGNEYRQQEPFKNMQREY